MMNKINIPQFLGARDLQKLGFSRSMAYRLLNMQVLEAFQIGGRKFIDKDLLFSWIDKNGKQDNSECE